MKKQVFDPLRKTGKFPQLPLPIKKNYITLRISIWILDPRAVV
jgi:hypothetical protein